MLEEIIVTAQKRSENLQDVPIAVTAIDNTGLEELGIQDFADFARMAPNLSFKNKGGASGATIIMRGAADGGDANPSGSQPSVGVYLDEAPVTSIGANLPIHIYDMERIEALGGPQGTLFGASSQSGTVRYITNKPDAEKFSGGFDVQGNGMTDGDTGYTGEAFVNVPLGESAAIRLVGWYLDEGGWIDNVPGGSYTYALTASFTGLPGTSFTKTNDAFAADDINELTKAGLRAALRVDLSENWVADASIIYQKLESEGVWEQGAGLADVGERNVQRFSDDSTDDEFTQFALTVDGEFADHRLVGTVAFSDRDVEYETGYHAYGQYLTFARYYGCDYTSPYYGQALPNTDCTSGEEINKSLFNWDRTSIELRLQSLADSRLHYTVGGFYEKIEFDYFLGFIQAGMASTLTIPNTPFSNVFFRTDQAREDTQIAVFGEVSYDLTDALSVTAGIRWFDEESQLSGVVGWGDVCNISFFAVPIFNDCTTGLTPATRFRDNDDSVDLKYSNTDAIYKGNISWNIDDEKMVYFTYSEGYRPGGLNREPALIALGLQEFKPDLMTNYEIGWKTEWLDQRLRFNGAAYLMDWDDIQFTIYEFGLSACCGNTYNLATARINGVEFDLTYLVSDALTVSLAGAYNDAETTADFILPNGNFSVPDGQRLPNIPEFQGVVNARYEFELANYDAYAQLNWSYTGDSLSEIRPPRVTGTAFEPRFPGDFENYVQDSYNIGNFRAGINLAGWGVDVFVNNLTDTNAILYASPRNYENTAVVNRPRTYGVNVWKRF
ncbi:MAG: TonB-dependent receptor [Gammaproteobacteria bacterium]|nr:TonB-dependent receptor [Gammaproteobacteria bacterium]